MASDQARGGVYLLVIGIGFFYYTCWTLVLVKNLSQNVPRPELKVYPSP
jgi:hypothetical protein